MEQYRITATAKNKQNKVWLVYDNDTLIFCIAKADRAIFEEEFDSVEVLEVVNNLIVYKIIIQKIIKNNFSIEKVFRHLFKKSSLR